MAVKKYEVIKQDKKTTFSNVIIMKKSFISFPSYLKAPTFRPKKSSVISGAKTFKCEKGNLPAEENENIKKNTRTQTHRWKIEKTHEKSERFGNRRSFHTSTEFVPRRCLRSTESKQIEIYEGKKHINKTHFAIGSICRFAQDPSCGSIDGEDGRNNTCLPRWLAGS